MPCSFHIHRPSAGFTLIELLVVISIVALLVSILLPVLGLARGAAHQSVSASHMRQIGIGIEMFQTDHGGYFPETTHGNPPEKSWVHTLAPYLQDVDEVRICPADPKGAIRLGNGGTSYRVNEYVSVPAFTGFSIDPRDTFNHRMRIVAPSRTLNVVVGSDHMTTTVSADHTHSRLWFGPDTWNNFLRVTSEVEVDRYNGGSRDNLGGGSNYLYADGHVANITPHQIKAWCDSGFNFARPPR